MNKIGTQIEIFLVIKILWSKLLCWRKMRLWVMLLKIYPFITGCDKLHKESKIKQRDEIRKKQVQRKIKTLKK